MLLFSRPFGPFETNTILLGCPIERVGVVFDPALGCTPFILEQAKKEGLFLERILLTHSHWDHIADLAQLKQALGEKARVGVAPQDALNVEQVGSDV